MAGRFLPRGSAGFHGDAKRDERATGVAGSRSTPTAVLLAVVALTGCGNGDDDSLPTCDDQVFAYHLRVAYTEGDPPFNGISQVARSEPTVIELNQDERFVELSFAATEGALLPAVGSMVDLVTRDEDTFLAVLTDPATGDLIFEAGDAALNSNVGHMAIERLDAEPICRGIGLSPDTIAVPGAVAFETDDGTLVLRNLEEATATIDGYRVELRVLNAFHFISGENTNDFGEAMIVRLEE